MAGVSELLAQLIGGQRQNPMFSGQLGDSGQTPIRPIGLPSLPQPEGFDPSSLLSLLGAFKGGDKPDAISPAGVGQGPFAGRPDTSGGFNPLEFLGKITPATGAFPTGKNSIPGGIGIIQKLLRGVNG